LADIGAAYGLNSVIFRYFNVTGADPEGEVGKFHQPKMHLILLILDAIDGKRDALTIFGTEYNTPDGTCIRDYVHVCDLVNAHVLGLNWLQSGRGGRAFNLGTGGGFSVRQVIYQAKHVTNRSVPIIEGARRPEDCTKLVSGSRRAETELGWSTGRSNLSQMITDAWSWHQTGDCQNCSKVLPEKQYNYLRSGFSRGMVAMLNMETS
jgi:UDP-glucose 4-epimerase